jgi:hypothetical protein
MLPGQFIIGGVGSTVVIAVPVLLLVSESLALDAVALLAMIVPPITD